MTNKISLSNKTLYQKIILFIAFGFGTGFIRPAPGTWGTLPGVLFAYWLMPFPLIHFVITLVVIIFGVWICQQASNILGVHDHGGIVIDEIAGVMLTLLFFEPSWQVLLTGFICFRVFDIIKPWPIGWIDKKIHGGLGIMLDDIIAGAFAWISLWLILLLSSI